MLRVLRERPPQRRFLFQVKIHKPTSHLTLSEVFEHLEHLTIERSESGRTSFLWLPWGESKMELETQVVSPWIAGSELQVENLFRSTCLQDVNNHIKIVCFRSNHGQLECNHQTSKIHIICSAGNNFSSLTGHVSFQILILVGHLINLTGH